MGQIEYKMNYSKELPTAESMRFKGDDCLPVCAGTRLGLLALVACLEEQLFFNFFF